MSMDEVVKTEAIYLRQHLKPKCGQPCDIKVGFVYIYIHTICIYIRRPAILVSTIALFSLRCVTAERFHQCPCYSLSLRIITAIDFLCCMITS